MIKDYVSLTKSGLVLGNIITVVAGFALGSRMGIFNATAFIATAVGIFFVMASGCVFNNIIDRDIDGRMGRTKDRVIVTGKVSPRSAFIFGAIIGILGFLILGSFTNALATSVALFGFFFYVAMYSLWFKRRNAFGTVIGSVSGAIPPVVGYAAATGRLDGAALLLFLIMVVWQMPHFYAIAIRRKDEYAAANVPVLPVARGLRATKTQMFLYVAAFVLIAPLLAAFGYGGRIYLVVSYVLGLSWLAVATQGLWISDNDEALNIRWARAMFFCSLIVLIVLFGTIALGA